MATSLSPYESRPETITEKVSASAAKKIPELTAKFISWFLYTFVRVFRAVVSAVMEAIRGH